MDFPALSRRLSQFAIDNSPHILTAVGIVGTVTTAYLTGRASYQAAGMIYVKESLDDERGRVAPEPKQVIKERVELVWRLYIPPVVMGVATLTCIIMSNRVSAGRAAGMATAFTVLERNYSEHKNKLVEKLGERKAEAFYDEIAQDRVNESYEIDGITMQGLDKGEVCYDMFGGQYFPSTVEKIRSAVNTLNASIISDGYATLADFYRHLDIDTPSFSESLGWNSNRLVDVRFSSTLIHETKPCLTITFRDDPMPDYGRFHR